MACVRGCREGDCRAEKEWSLRQRIADADRPQRLADAHLEDVRKRENQDSLSRYRWVERLKKQIDLKKELPDIVAGLARWAEIEAARAESIGHSLDQRMFFVARRAGVTQPDLIRINHTRPRPPDPRIEAAAEVAGLLRDNSFHVPFGFTVLLSGTASEFERARQFRLISQFERYGSIASFFRAFLEQVIEHGYANSPLVVDALAFASSAFRDPISPKLLGSI